MLPGEIRRSAASVPDASGTLLLTDAAWDLAVHVFNRAQLATVTRGNCLTPVRMRS